MKWMKDFIKLESSAAVLLGIAALLAILIKNSPAQHLYDALVAYPLLLQMGPFSLHQPAVIWVNDLLMSGFFLLVGLELKRESLEGQLSTQANRNLPAIAALGGILFPALIYAYCNKANSLTLTGWAIPTATDIAFALGVVTLLGNRVPSPLKLCLLSLAIFDDIAAILIIAMFYTTHLSLYWLLLSLIPLLILVILNHCAIQRLTPYLITGSILWICVLQSGIHATLAGIVLAFCIPLKTNPSSRFSPLKHLEHTIHPWISFGILPIFAFFNAGVSLQGLSFSMLTHPVTLGITIGLFMGKQMGVMLFSAIGIQCQWCRLPKDVTWLQFYGMALTTGIGFTMSIFIGTLAFSQADHQTSVRLGVIMGSLLSGMVGYSVLSYSISKNNMPMHQKKSKKNVT
jgi:NhaA family Na+:H+ antiporter